MSTPFLQRMLNGLLYGPYQQDDLHPASPRFGIRPRLLVRRLTEKNWIERATCRVVEERPLWVFVSQCMRGGTCSVPPTPAFAVDVYDGVRALRRYGGEFENLGEALAYANGEDDSSFARDSRAPRNGEAPCAEERPRFVVRYRRGDDGVTAVGRFVLQLDAEGDEVKRGWARLGEACQAAQAVEILGETTAEAGERILAAEPARREYEGRILARQKELGAEYLRECALKRAEEEAARAREEAAAAEEDDGDEDDDCEADEDEDCRVAESDEFGRCSACPFCGCEWEREGGGCEFDTGYDAYHSWKERVLPPGWQCPHLVFYNCCEGWDFQVERGPLAPEHAEDWLVGPRDQAFRLLTALERLREACDQRGPSLEEALERALGAFPPWCKPYSSGAVDRSLRWVTDAKLFGLEMDYVLFENGGPGTCLPAVSYYAESPERMRLEISKYFEEQAERLEGVLGGCP